MTFNVVNGWGFSIPKANRANQVSSFDTNMKPQKTEFIFPHFWLILRFWAILEKKNSSFVSVVGAGMDVCSCVCYEECCRGQWGLKYYDSMPGTNEILASKPWHCQKSNNWHFETAILVLHNYYFFVFYYG